MSGTWPRTPGESEAADAQLFRARARIIDVGDGVSFVELEFGDGSLAWMFPDRGGVTYPRIAADAQRNGWRHRLREYLREIASERP